MPAENRTRAAGVQVVLGPGRILPSPFFFCFLWAGGRAPKFSLCAPSPVWLRGVFFATLWSAAVQHPLLLFCDQRGARKSESAQWSFFFLFFYLCVFFWRSDYGKLQQLGLEQYCGSRPRSALSSGFLLVYIFILVSLRLHRRWRRLRHRHGWCLVLDVIHLQLTALGYGFISTQILVYWCSSHFLLVFPS